MGSASMNENVADESADDQQVKRVPEPVAHAEKQAQSECDEVLHGVQAVGVEVMASTLRSTLPSSFSTEALMRSVKRPLRKKWSMRRTATTR